MNRKLILLNDYQIFTCIREFSIDDDRYLSDIELKIWNNEKKFLRNGKNWFSGRVAAKYVIADCLNINLEEMKNFHIKNKSNGAPILVTKRKDYLALSISHCNEIGFACSSKFFKNIGCDIESVRNRHPKFSSYYLSSSEEKIWTEKIADEDKDTILTITWSCKEASFKCLTGLMGNSKTIKDIRIYPIVSNFFNFYFIYKNKKGLGYWSKYKNFIISISVLL
ncbi:MULTISPECIES: 4'-phosphopantetheinyl transferase superfamily protein [Lysinibacillus]|uniref:4'-phosphopantetheinyl transferase superfamily protein n=1 Tax=Lysinibacillus capsici TaxID=2115968 RepID=A0ABY8KND6_9BACI|nr:4'-phosphopantetheinyl transferase superfamily protein [Lysinibacillus capsici]MCT1538522.1 4'-phosphopantetheinyl transferase superfamily protein [Lysinibacillus capsici]MCT1569230.1 4'-phosphopantetheinyl transferase superfamily protein [Lysinibacillus capsici]MCT1646245.1 4'-phosphopantetheinyl transferase superfamily protein [Lysinibacillus capsici]MCT1725249.1 4'-phosphopantetheinyl transferase superfamily protein [Lysinibacillus capsici]MCT1784029.1 4'-phosphopantetheinyl transferase 